MFQVGDKIVHPMHGAGVVDSIVQKKVNGVVREYYILKLPVGVHGGHDPHREQRGDRGAPRRETGRGRPGLAAIPASRWT